MTEENSVLNENILTLEKNCQEQKQTLHESNMTLNSQKEEIDGLLKQLAELEGYELLPQFTTTGTPGSRKESTHMTC